MFVQFFQIRSLIKSKTCSQLLNRSRVTSVSTLPPPSPFAPKAAYQCSPGPQRVVRGYLKMCM